ncbi:hypothetical protein [Geobacter pickeringii]|uniref:hypothetical protein n=1 Tax=Geobacter pickeringii TaxID=345632 RepID=UPI001F1EA6B9|nr:hypothetical protein [Geobacter pickeringii]
MHIVISWDIKADGANWKELNEKMKGCLSGYSWVKPLTTLYIVKIYSSEDRKQIRDDLVSVCRDNPKKVNFIMSPAMEGGSYSGWLPKSLWPKIEKRTED